MVALRSTDLNCQIGVVAALCNDNGWITVQLQSSEFARVPDEGAILQAGLELRQVGGDRAASDPVG